MVKTFTYTGPKIQIEPGLTITINCKSYSGRPTSVEIKAALEALGVRNPNGTTIDPSRWK